MLSCLSAGVDPIFMFLLWLFGCEPQLTAEPLWSYVLLRLIFLLFATQPKAGMVYGPGSNYFNFQSEGTRRDYHQAFN